MYAVNETDVYEGHPSGAVSAFAVEKERLTLLNRNISNGKNPCHIAVDSAGRYGVAAHYTSGTLSVFSLKPDGSLGGSAQSIQYAGSGPNPDRQECAHAHFFMFDKTGAGGYACDLGSDRILSYRFDKTAPEPLTPAGVYHGKPGSGPRHGVFHPNGRFGYFVNELDSTVIVLQPEDGGFKTLQSLSTLPLGTEVSNIAAAIKISPDGRFLYASNRGHDSIAAYAVRADGSLAWIDAISSEGKTPRDFEIDPTGNFLLVCNQDSDTLEVFRIDRQTGRFKRIGGYAVPSGVCVIFS